MGESGSQPNNNNFANGINIPLVKDILFWVTIIVASLSFVRYTHAFVFGAQMVLANLFHAGYGLILAYYGFHKELARWLNVRTNPKWGQYMVGIWFGLLFLMGALTQLFPDPFPFGPREGMLWDLFWDAAATLGVLAGTEASKFIYLQRRCKKNDTNSQ